MPLRGYFLRHGQVLLGTIGKMVRNPVPQLFTILVIAIAIALPAVLYMAVSNLSYIGEEWDGRVQISVFLKQEMTSNEAIEFGEALLMRPVIDDIEFISPDEAMHSFQASSGFGDLLDQLDDNPIPPLLVVFPDVAVNASEIEQLTDSLRKLPEVDNASFDQLWLQRLQSILKLIRYIIIILACMMSLGVLLIVSNTVRLSISERKREVEIIDQIGGTHAFIRRPFLYLGMLQSVSGCLLAILLVEAVYFLVKGPVNDLSALYESSFILKGIDWSMSMVLILLAAVLGWCAAWISVSRHFARIQRGADNGSY